MPMGSNNTSVKIIVYEIDCELMPIIELRLSSMGFHEDVIAKVSTMTTPKRNNAAKASARDFLKLAYMSWPKDLSRSPMFCDGQAGWHFIQKLQ